jgi:hypothetical protein
MGGTTSKITDLQQSTQDLSTQMNETTTFNSQTYATKSELDTKASLSDLEKLKNSVIWCADGNVCKMPPSAAGVQIGAYLITTNQDNSQTCIQNETIGFCLDRAGTLSEIPMGSSTTPASS